MKEAKKLSKAFERLEKKYPGAAKELAKEFTTAIGVAAAKAKLAAAKAKMEAESRDQMHIITVEGRGPDRRLYRAEFEAIFPKGTEIMCVKARDRG